MLGQGRNQGKWQKRADMCASSCLNITIARSHEPAAGDAYTRYVYGMHACAVCTPAQRVHPCVDESRLCLSKTGFFRLEAVGGIVVRDSTGGFT